MAKKKKPRKQWYQYKGLDESEVMPTHPAILKRLRVEYPQTKDELGLCIDEHEAFFADADYRNAIQHLRSI
jgi:hypothetical protein